MAEKIDIAEVRKYLAVLEQKTRKLKEGKEEHFIVFRAEAIEAETPYYRKLSDIIHKYQGDQDTAYQQIFSCLTWLEENCEDKSIDELQDIMSEAIDVEVDVYTSNLTEWLNRSNNNVYYLSQALEEFAEKDGFKALAQAQYLAIQEIWNEVFALFTGSSEGHLR